MIEVIASTGTATLVGAMPTGTNLEFDASSFFLANKRLMAVIEGGSNPVEFIPKLIEMHREGKFPVEKLGKLYPAGDIEEAMKDMHDGKVGALLLLSKKF